MAGAEKGDGGIMIDRLREHRADEGDITDDAADVRDEFAQFDACFSIALERISRTDT